MGIPLQGSWATIGKRASTEQEPHRGLSRNQAAFQLQRQGLAGVEQPVDQRCGRVARGIVALPRHMRGMQQGGKRSDARRAAGGQGQIEGSAWAEPGFGSGLALGAQIPAMRLKVREER